MVSEICSRGEQKDRYIFLRRFEPHLFARKQQWVRSTLAISLKAKTKGLDQKIHIQESLALASMARDDSPASSTAPAYSTAANAR